VVWEADPQTLELTFASPHVREIFGVSPMLFIRKWSDHVHPDDREREETGPLKMTGMHEAPGRLP
jgi:hypothetical protein